MKKSGVFILVFSFLAVFGSIGLAKYLSGSDNAGVLNRASSYNGNARSSGSAPQQVGCACCSARQQKGGQQSVENRAEKIAFEYYASRYGDRDITVEIRDFGCHMEAYIRKGKTVVRKLSISGNNIYEIG